MPPYFFTAVATTLILRMGWQVLKLPPNKTGQATLYSVASMWATVAAIHLFRAGL